MKKFPVFNLLVIVIVLIAFFLRVYKFDAFVTFLGDQGRDAIIIKRILTLEHFPAIGAPTSIGQIYLGPFYYYLISPFLFLSNFNPIGLAYGVLFLTMLGIIVTYLIVWRYINKSTAFYTLVLITFSAVNIEFARFSWNPNLLPVFSFLTLFFFYRFIKSKKGIYPVLFGAFLSFSIQLHYLALFMLFPMAIIYIYSLFKNKNKEKIRIFLDTLISIAAFFLCSVPLIIFDFKHQFLNSRNFIQLFTGTKTVSGSSLFTRLAEVNQALLEHLLKVTIDPIVASVILTLIGIVLLFVLIRTKNMFIALNSLHIFFFLIAFSLLASPRYPHYYTVVYYSVFLILAYLLAQLQKKYILSLLFITPLMIMYAYLNIKSTPYFTQQGSYQIKRAQDISNSIINHNPADPYQVVALPYTEVDSHVRYFLEIAKHRPLPEDTLQEPTDLFVLCMSKECSVLGNPQWQIASFKRAKVDIIWNIDDITIYKLVHGQ